jgi:O-antigen biosynthesis protein WbqP
MLYLLFKRFYDTLGALIALIIFSPLFIIIVILIKLESKGPILFKQKRIGRHKKHFNILKFRTMRIDTPKDIPTHMLENPEKWITKMGKILRKTSLDEIPQIINILKGDMSIIGPRPALWNQFDLIGERDKYGVHNLYPGITGYAQIKGRDTLPIKDKAKLDGDYAKNISLSLDIKIFILTFVSIIKSEGVVEGGTGTLEKTKIQIPKV